MKIMLFLKTLCTYIIMCFVGALFVIPCLFIALLPAKIRYNSRLYYWFINIFYKVIVWAAFLPVKIFGKEHIPNTPAIFIANHQSSLDIPLFGSIVNGYPHVWLFLKKFTKIPILGFIARRMNIVVDHSGLRKLVKSLHDSIALIKGQNRHVMLFPEGGRYTDGKIHNFFYGFAMIAKETGRPVIPVYMKNLSKSYPPHSFLIHNYPISVYIGKPFILQPTETEQEFVERVRKWFVQFESE